jgi:FkbM family methyltransferase
MHLTDILKLGSEVDPVFTDKANVSESTFGFLERNPFVMYGAGEAAHWFYEVGVKRNRLTPLAIIDQRASEIKNYKGIPCIDLKEAFEEFGNIEIDIVVCVGQFESFLTIRANLQKHGFSKVHYLGWFYEIHNLLEVEFSGESEWRRMFKQNETAIVSAYAQLDDELSQSLFAQLINAHYHRQPRRFPRRPRDEQHFPKDIILAKGCSSLVVCGAYDGEALRLLKQNGINSEKIYLFEPEPEIFTQLVINTAEYQKEYGIDVYAIPMATSESTAMVSFLRGCGLGSKISDEGNCDVQAVSLDDFFGNQNISRITMDIEGQEAATLLGAVKLIKSKKPDLSISVYHDPKQLWEIPSLISSIQSGYKFYLRNYTSYAVETVLYATYE